MNRRMTHQEAPQRTANDLARDAMGACFCIAVVCAFWFSMFVVAGVFDATEIERPANRGSQPLDGPAGNQQYRPISSTAAATAQLPALRQQG